MAYQPPQMQHWHGRVDSTTDFDAFRWHQWVQPLNVHAINQLEQSPQLAIGFIGFACDLGITLNGGRPGASLGPKMIKANLSNLPCLFDQGLKLYDCGDIVMQDETLNQLQNELQETVEKVLALGLFPIVLGGGHEVALGHYRALKSHHDDLGIVNLDAHLDMRPYTDTGSSGTMFRQIADECITKHQPFNYLCLGLQRRGNTRSLLMAAKNYGAETVYASDITATSVNDVADRVLRFARKTKKIYLTLCTDVIASAYAPGVSASQPLGMHPELVLKLIKAAVRTDRLVGFDVAEVSPRFDYDNVTANLACTFVFALVNELADLHGHYLEI